MCLITGHSFVVVIAELALVFGVQQEMGVHVFTISTPAPRSEEQSVDRWVLRLGNQGGVLIGRSSNWLPSVRVGEAFILPFVIEVESELGSSFLNAPRT